MSNPSSRLYGTRAGRPAPPPPPVPPSQRSQRPVTLPITPPRAKVIPPPPPPRPTFHPSHRVAPVPPPPRVVEVDPPNASPIPGTPQERRSLWVRLGSNWLLWAVVGVALFGGVAAASAVSLLRIPNLPNCRAIFWPLAAASTRLQCADAYADQGSVESLLAAIALVEQLPPDHPLRGDINDRVEGWAEQILAIADRTFHDGDIDAAMAIARRIPTHTAAAALVSDRLAQWEATWEEANGIFEAAWGHLEQSQFREAFNEAIKLHGINNRYWRTTKYEELVALITQGRQDANRISQARTLVDRGTLAAITEALDLLEAIDPDRPLYQEALTLIKAAGQGLLTLAEDALARGDSQQADAILAKIPPQAELTAEVNDFQTLSAAYALTREDSAVGYEAAIARLQSIGSDRPLYGRAQSLMEQWQQQVQGVALLDWARQVAQPGTAADLRRAITEARRVSRDSPRWAEAQRQIDRWQREVDRIEDGPYLAQARQLAAPGDRASLTAAIATAQNVESSSSLHGEAQELISSWRWELQRMDNTPVLSQARQLAAAGNLTQAIAVANQIPQGQALYSDAQGLVTTWRGETTGQDQLNRAYQVAEGGTVNALVQAIELAQGVPERSSRWQEAQNMVNQWSWTLLSTAEAEMSRDISRAIQVARQVPPRSEAYANAQLRIQEWSALLP